MKYIFEENGKLNGCGECLIIADGFNCIEVSDELYEAYSLEPDKYMYLNGNVIENPDYESIRQKNAMQQRMEEIKSELDDLDTKRIRAVCEDEVKSERTGETWLDYYNAKIYDLRIEYKSLEEQL